MNINKLRMKKGKKGRRAFVPPESISSYLRAQQQMHEKEQLPEVGHEKEQLPQVGYGKEVKEGMQATQQEQQALTEDYQNSEMRIPSNEQPAEMQTQSNAQEINECTHETGINFHIFS